MGKSTSQRARLIGSLTGQGPSGRGIHDPFAWPSEPSIPPHTALRVAPNHSIQDKIHVLDPGAAFQLRAQQTAKANAGEAQPAALRVRCVGGIGRPSLSFLLVSSKTGLGRLGTCAASPPRSKAALLLSPEQRRVVTGWAAHLRDGGPRRTFLSAREVRQT